MVDDHESVSKYVPAMTISLIMILPKVNNSKCNVSTVAVLMDDLLEENRQLIYWITPFFSWLILLGIKMYYRYMCDIQLFYNVPNVFSFHLVCVCM